MLFLWNKICWCTVQLKYWKTVNFHIVFRLNDSVLKQLHSSSWYKKSSYCPSLHTVLLSFGATTQQSWSDATLDPLQFSGLLAERWWWCSPSKLHFHSHSSHCIIKNQNSHGESLFNRASFRNCIAVSFLWWQTADSSCIYDLCIELSHKLPNSTTQSNGTSWLRRPWAAQQWFLFL